MEPSQALMNLHTFAESNVCTGAQRDLLRQSAEAINAALKELAALKVKKAE